MMDARDERVDAAKMARLAAKYSVFPTTTESKLREELGYSVGDANRFFGAFAKEFRVDLTRLNLATYFDGLERLLQFPEFSWLLRITNPAVRAAWSQLPGRSDISIPHLVRVAERGEWFDPPPPAIPTKPMSETQPWVVLTWILRALTTALAIGLAFVAASTLWRAGIAFQNGANMAAIGLTFAAALHAFMFLYPMYIRTQHEFRKRFGMRWDFRRNKLKPASYDPDVD